MKICNTGKTGLIILFLSTFFACDPRRVFEENKKLPEQGWDMNNKLVFHTSIPDTVSAHNVYLNVRNSGDYPFSNVFLFVKTTLPNGHITLDTVECTLANPEGKWLGDGLGDIWDNQILYKHNVRFPVQGDYVFELEQAMRVNPLPSIMDAGIRIEKIKPPKK